MRYSGQHGMSKHNQNQNNKKSGRHNQRFFRIIVLVGSTLWVFMLITQFRLIEKFISSSNDVQIMKDWPSSRSSRATASRGRNTNPASGNINSIISSPPPPPPNKRVTSHWCHSRDLLKDNSKRASCLFHDVCIVQRPPDSIHGNKRHEVEFLYVYNNNNDDNGNDDNDSKKIFNQRKMKRVSEGDASFTLGIGPHSGDERLVFAPVPISMEEINAQYPDRNYVTGTSVLYYEYNSENFGHFLTDVLLPIYAALQGFGLEDHQDITLYRYSIEDAIGYSCDFWIKDLASKGGVHPRYGNVSKHCDRFHNMTQDFMRGHRPLEVMNGTTVQPTCFQKLVVGMPMYSDDCDEGSHGREQKRWSLCNHARQGQFWQFRNYLLQNVLSPGNGYDNVDVEHDLPKHHKITIASRNDSVRGFANLDELIRRVKEKYNNENINSNVEVVVVEWEKLSIKDQLELIRTTTVHITPPGGVSHIALFLPRWATSIRLYTTEFKLEWHIFHYLGYLLVEHVNCEEKVIPLDETMLLVEEGLHRYDDYRVGDSNANWQPFVQLGPSDPKDMAPHPLTMGGTSIPHTVYQSWTSRDMAPSMTANLNKWKSMNHDDYEFVFFDDKEQRGWMENKCTKYWPAWEDMKLPAARADLFRYCLLYVNGGVWSDIDVVPKRQLQDFITSSIELVVVHDGGMPGEEFLYNAFMAAVPGHPVLKRAMDIVMEHYQVRLKKGAVWCTGPHVLWRAVNDTMGQVQPKSYVGIDKKHMIEYLSFNENSISSADKGLLLDGKYRGYLDDAKMHGGEPHYGREVTWFTKVSV